MKYSIIVGALLGFLVGAVSVYTQRSIETDCKKLGTFYIGDRVYECKLKERNT
jgi:hypothetical protein